MTLDSGQRPCAFPPHPGGDGGDPGLVAESALSRLRGWLAHAPAERVPLPAIPAVWAAAWVMHLAGMPGLYPGAATLAAAGLAVGLGEAHARGGERKRLRGAELAAATAITGAWVTAADVSGPLAGRYHLLTLVYAASARRRLLVAAPSRGRQSGQAGLGRARPVDRAQGWLAPPGARPRPGRVAPAALARDTPR